MALVDFALDFARLAPAEIIKVPECIDGKDKVPDGQSREVHEEPVHVYDAARGQ